MMKHCTIVSTKNVVANIELYLYTHTYFDIIWYCVIQPYLLYAVLIYRLQTENKNWIAMAERNDKFVFYFWCIHVRPISNDTLSKHVLKGKYDYQ